MAKILIVDDEKGIRESLGSALERRGHETTAVEDLKAARGVLSEEFDIILLDLMLPDGNGIDLLREIKAASPGQMVVMISGHADVETAVSAIRLGAYDFIEKPISLDRVLITIDNARRTNQLINEARRLTSRLYGDFVGESEKIRQLKAVVEKSAPKASRFLVLGENGSGKELVANMIHSHSKFAGGPFVAVNCAALPSELVESELFGHTRGAFTGANANRRGRFVEANGGSIFLDEISEMPLAAQAKILRVIETQEVTPVGSDRNTSVSLNIIAASNKDLRRLVADQRFREDLLYRLNVIEFTIPPLRERVEDIGLLCEHFLKRFAGETGHRAKRLAPEAKKYLAGYSFPGNVRELKNLMERVNIYCEGDTVDVGELKPLLPYFEPEPKSTLRDAVANFEYKYIKAAIARADGNISLAARELGLERSHLYKKIKRLEDD